MSGVDLGARDHNGKSKVRISGGWRGGRWAGMDSVGLEAEQAELTEGWGLGED